MAPKEFKQIHNYVGKKVEVEFRNGRIAFGTLSFYDWQHQVIHLSDYDLFIPDKEGADKIYGELMVINCKEWSILQAKTNK